MTDIGGGWYMKKTAKELTPVKISKIIKNHKRSRMKLKKLYKSNKWYNYCKVQLHWNNLERVDPKFLIKRDKPYLISSKIYT